jgi:tetratricopeptide (TPR) repeat protein
MLKSALPAVALALLATACDKLPLPGRKAADSSSASSAGAPAMAPAVQQGKALMDQGQLDAALAKLQELPDDPVSLYYQGVVHVRKGLAAPLPETGYREEDKLAAQALERAIAAKPEFAAAHFTLAELLAVYARQHHNAPARKGRGRPPTPAPDDPDASPERVARAYQAAVQHDKTSRAPIDALIKFAREMKRPDDADLAYRELLLRDKEKPEPHMLYGDFLAKEKKDRLKAVEQYQLALVWAPQDPTPKQKICETYIDWAQEHYDAGEWANADARLKDAQRFLPGPQSPEARRIQELRATLGELRGR